MIHSTVKAATASKEKDNDRSLSSHIITLHRRLLHSLNLGTRSLSLLTHHFLRFVLWMVYCYLLVCKSFE